MQNASPGRILVIIALNMGFSQAAELAKGTVLDVRLVRAAGTTVSRVGDHVQGILIAPANAGPSVVLPAGALVSGVVSGVRRVGLGLKRESATLDLRFESIAANADAPVTVATRLLGVDTAKEWVDSKGRLRGVRSTDAFSYRAGSFPWHIGGFLCPLFLFEQWAAKTALLPIPEPEIHLPAGAELRLRLEEAVGVPEHWLQASSATDGQPVPTGVLASIPVQTRSAYDSRPADVVNLAFLAQEQDIRSAFEVAGWSRADPRTRRSSYQALYSIVFVTPYRTAPMSTLLLNDAPPALEYQKSLNTFAKRHHVRIWPVGATEDGVPLWAAAATEDIGIAVVAKKRPVTHFIDADIDRERTKVVNDLRFTGCATTASLVERPGLEKELRNAGGDLLYTDGRVALVSLGACANPRTGLDEEPSLPARRHAMFRYTRRAVLSFRSDLWRGNALYAGYSYARDAIKSASARRRYSARPDVLAAKR